MRRRQRITGGLHTINDIDRFGFSVAVSKEHLLVGANGVDEAGTDAGAAYFIENTTEGETFPFGELTTNTVESDLLGGTFGTALNNLGTGTLEWTANSEAEWVTITSGQTGETSLPPSAQSNGRRAKSQDLMKTTSANNIQFSVTENTGPSRTAVISVESENALNSPYLVEILQEGNSNIVSGYVLDQGFLPVTNVNVEFRGSYDTLVTSDINGYYECMLDYGWTGVVKPNSIGFNSAPQHIAIDTLKSDLHLNGFVLTKRELNLNVELLLSAPDGIAGDRIGNVVAVSDYFAAISGNNLNHNLNGAVYLYKFSNNQWTFHSKLEPSNFTSYPQFGSSISFYNDYLIIGAPGENSYKGAVYIYKYDGINWLLESKIIAADGVANDYFGSAVDIDDQYAIIGAKGLERYGHMQVGGVYIYKNDGSSWSFHKKLFGLQYYHGEKWLGKSVAISGDFAIAGMEGKDDMAGRAEVFVLDNGSWTNYNTIVSPPNEIGDYFGSCVDMSGNKIIIGSPRTNWMGAAYIYELINNSWVNTATVFPDIAAWNTYGYSVSLEGDYAAVGSFAHDGNNGAVYVYKDSAGTWLFKDKLLPITNYDNNHKPYLGWDVSLHGSNLLAGTYYYYKEGSAHLFTDINLLNPVTISGTITDNNGLPKSNIEIIFSDNIKDTTDVNGNYSRIVYGGWSGSVKPNLYGWIFNPDSIHYNSVTSNQQNQNFDCYENTIILSHPLKLSPTDPVSPMQFGYSVALTDSFAVITAPYAGNNMYLYKYENPQWNFKTKISPTGSNIGQKLAVSDNYLFAGGMMKAYIFKKENDSTLVMQKEINWADHNYIYFRNMTINDDYAVLSTDGGKVYVYVRNNDTWNLAYQVTGDENNTNVFGHSLSLDNNLLCVGDYAYNNNDGTVKVVYLSNTGYQAKGDIYSFHPYYGTRFGYSISVSGDYLVVGAPIADSFKGRVFVYKKISNGFFTYYSEISDANSDQLGHKVKLFYNHIAAKSGYRDCSIYKFSNGNWNFVEKLNLGHDISMGLHSFDVSNNSLIVGTPNDPTVGTQIGAVYIYRDSLSSQQQSTITSIKAQEELPSEFSLAQNHPNPFNPTTKINYALPVTSKVKVSIYDITGRLIKTFKAEEQSAGYHRFEWNSTNSNGIRVASGVYIYRMEAIPLEEGHQPFMQTKKMILLR